MDARTIFYIAEKVPEMDGNTIFYHSQITKSKLPTLDNGQCQ